VIGAIALFGVVFQLLLFQLTPGSGGVLAGGASLGGDDSPTGDDGAPAKSLSVAPAQQHTPAPVVTSTS
jgi:hypothetical protein